jgi:pyruvate/2-oxoglutarate dehydrogenase complex dihydrolipoamide dehydrogenase (E3) component
MVDQGKGAIGGTSTLGTGQQNITYGVMPEQITSKLQENPGAEFIVIQRVRQSEDPKVWASGDPAQTSQLFEHATQFLGAKERVTG